MMEFSNEKLMIEMYSHLKALRKRADVLEARLDNQVELLKQVLLEYYPEEEEEEEQAFYSDNYYVVGDTIVAVLIRDCEESTEPSKYSVYSDHHGIHYSHQAFKNINHSCDANTIPYLEGDYFCFLAIKPIKKDDEITFNYIHNENEVKNPFDCYCGSANCVGRVE